MIFKAIIDALVSVIKVALSFINLPQVPEKITEGVDWLFDQLVSAARVIGFFIRWETVLILLPLLLLVINLDKVYNFIMWVLRKIPMLGIK